jgi:hypothetical protein
VISCHTEQLPSGSTEPTAPVGHTVLVPGVPDILPAKTTPSVEIKEDLHLLEQFVQDGKESSHVSTPSGVDMVGRIPTDSFTVVMGFLEKFDQIGRELSKVSVLLLYVNFFHSHAVIQVHPYAQLAWKVLTAAQKVCISCQG